MLVWEQVLRQRISPECFIYALALVKFAEQFYPKEALFPDYMELRAHLANDPNKQNKFENYIALAFLQTYTVFFLQFVSPPEGI